MTRQMHRHDQLRGYGGGDCRQGDWIVEVAHRPSTKDVVARHPYLLSRAGESAQ